MLCVTNDGRKIGLNQRLMQPGCPDNPNSKVNMCVNNVFDIYTKTAPNRSTQVIFCDMSTPKSDARQDRFEIYRPDKSKDSGFDLIRKKVGLGSGDEDRSKRISSFADIKSYEHISLCSKMICVHSFFRSGVCISRWDCPNQHCCR